MILTKSFSMRLRIFILPILILLLSSCGKNKKEFQKVYDFYSKPEDSLKLKAAEFLVQNMDKHDYLVLKNEEKFDDFFQTIGKQVSMPDLGNIRMQKRVRRNIVDNLISEGLEDGSLPKPEYTRSYDIKTIKADFLIENIEYAFKAWSFPWAKDYSFGDFCKYILPYRYGNEPLESWRKDIFEEYKWIADSLKNATALEATVLLNKQFQSDFSTSKALAKNGIRVKVSNQLDAGLFVDCFDQAGLGVCVLRALGIPATVVRIPKWGNRNAGHDMTAILSLENEWSSFNFAGRRDPVAQPTVDAPKMFFRQFDKDEDASSKLMNTVDLEVEVNAGENDEIYLCVFSYLSWYPLYKGKNLKSKVIFEDVGYNKSLFLAAVKSEGKLKPVSPVFVPDSLGNINYYKPIKTKKFSATLERKYPGLDKGMERLISLIGGEFTIDDTKNFENKNQLFKIDTILEYRDNIIKVPKQSGKYVRYEFPQRSDSLDSRYNGPAEISFYTTNQGKLEKIQGKYFGSHQLSQNHINLMTDNDFLSFVRVWESQVDLEIETGEYIFRKDKQPIWIGMEMSKETTITHVGICPRNDQNGVFPGMNYELFYWDNSWISLGVKEATTNSITYNEIPENALLWLRNLDKGKEERIFTMVDGKQVWY